MAQTFDIWYVPSAKGPLPRLFKLWPWDKNDFVQEITCVT